MSYLAYVGSRTTAARNARGVGLTVYSCSGEGPWQLLQTLTGFVNPSYLAMDQSCRFLYAVHGDESEVSSFSIDPLTGLLAHLGTVGTGGRNPVHLMVDSTNMYVLVANHLTSSLAVLPRLPDGRLGDVVDLVVLNGTPGPHRTEQPFSKPHQLASDPNGSLIAVPDKGLDCVFTFRFDAARGRLFEAAQRVPSRECAGPRHIAFHPSLPFAYAVNELASTVTAFRVSPKDPCLAAYQILPSLPETFTGNSRGAAIAVSPSGGELAVTNRGHDSVALFGIDADTGTLSPRHFHLTGGRTPRFLAYTPSGELIVANEDSDSIMTIDRSGVPHLLAETGSPVCVLFREEAASG